MARQNLETEVEVDIPVVYRDQELDVRYRIDLLVEDALVVETKAVEEIRQVHEKQLLTYLRLSQNPLGPLLNFNEPTLPDGIHRLVN